MSEEWLETGSLENTAKVPSVPAAPPAAVPVEFAARVALVEDCWGRLSPDQRAFLTAWRECGFNARAANRMVHGQSHTNSSHTKWSLTSDYATVMRVWRAMAGEKALDKDRLLARQDAIVETLLTPKPVLYQGIAVRDPRDPSGVAVLEEVEAGAASRANEVLMQAAGVIKSGKDVEVNVGVAIHNGPPTLNIQVMPTPDKAKASEGVVIDAKFTEVPDDGWLGA